MSLTSKIAALLLVFITFGVTLGSYGQTSGFDSEALSRVRRGSENDGEYLSRLLNKSMTSVRSQSHFCDLYQANELPPNPWEQDRAKQDAQVCALVETLNPSSKIKFDGSEPGNFCAPFWPGGNQPWKGKAKIEAGMKTYATKKYVPPSRQEMLNRGYGLMAREEVQAYFNKIDVIREKSASICCGTGAEEPECTQAMRDVKIQICRDEAAEKDPSQPDSCSTANGFYRLENSEYMLILKQMMHDATLSKQIPKSTIDFAKGFLGPSFDSEEIKAMNLVPGDKVVSGKIVLSPYTEQGAPRAEEMTLVHEFMHACSSIRKQLDVKNDTHLASSSMQALMERVDSTCAVSPATVKSYSGLIRSVSIDRDGLSGCLAEIARKSPDPKSTSYVPDACPDLQMEEGFANAMTILTSNPRIPKGYPHFVCSSIPSTAHPHLSEVMKCLVAHAPSYKKAVKEAFNCPVASIQ